MEFNYIKESAKTNNVDVPSILDRLSQQERFLKLMSVLADYSMICEQLDVFKKGIFYGKEEALKFVDMMETPTFTADISTKFTASLDTAGFDYVNLLHGVIGLATETGELVDAFAQPLSEGSTFDYVNIGEEVGDLCWYQARILETVNKTFEDVQVANIKKLLDKQSGRYKSGSFTAEEAIERNVVAERANLENNLA
jgi:hypothetical protein